MKLLNNNRGTATIEMAIMLPVYVMLIIVMIYFGGKQIMDIRVAKEVSVFSQTSGVQSIDDLPNSFLELPKGMMDYLNKTAIVSDEEIDNEFDEEYFKEIMVENMYNATGRYVMQGDTLVYTTSMNLTGIGRYVQTYGLIDTVETISEHMEKGIVRTETSIEVELEAPFSVFDEDVAGKSYTSGGLINQQASTTFTINHSHSHVLVGETLPEHNAFFMYEDSAVPEFLDAGDYPRLPVPENTWENYWESNLTEPP